MRPYLMTVLLLCASNVFMTFAWYGHLKNLSERPWVIAALVSWGIALLEYLLQVPANRYGHQVMTIGQLKILQEVIYAFCLCAILLSVHERKTDAGLSVGRAVPFGRGFFHLSPTSERLSRWPRVFAHAGISPEPSINGNC